MMRMAAVVPANRIGRVVPAWLVVCLLFLAVGCSRQDGPRRLRVPVRGVVTFDGKPLDFGDIIFSNRDAGEVDACRITDGGFKGMVCPGTRRVEIISVPPRGKDAQPIMDVAESRLPSRYSVNSKLTADVQEKGTNEFKFELTSK